MEYTYHYHEGNDVNGGGCYQQTTKKVECGNIYKYDSRYPSPSHNSNCASVWQDLYCCNSCGTNTGWKCGGGGNSCGFISGQIAGTHYKTITLYVPACGYEDGQILSATIIY